MNGNPFASSASQRASGSGTALAVVDGVAAFCGRLGDILLVAIAVMLFYEVVARYVFLAPTIWTQDVALAFQIWFTYLGMAYVLRQRQLIRITAVLVVLGPRARRSLEGFSLLVIAAFGIIAVIHGWDTVAESMRLGRRQPTMLEMPSWITELPVVIGFALLTVQALAELIRLPSRPPPDFTPGGEHGLDQESS